MTESHVTSKLFVTHMYSIDTHKSSVFAKEINVLCHIPRTVCKSMYLHNFFFFSPCLVPGAAVRCVCTVLWATALRITMHTLAQFTVKWANSEEAALFHFWHRLKLDVWYEDHQQHKQPSRILLRLVLRILYLHRRNGPIILWRIAFTVVFHWEVKF